MININGVVIDKQTNEFLPNAHVYISDNKGNKVTPVQGTTSNIDGKYNLELEGNNVPTYISSSFIGYKTQTQPLANAPHLSSGIMVNFSLSESSHALDEVVITPDDDKKRNWKKIALVGGVSLASLLLIAFVIKK